MEKHWLEDICEIKTPNGKPLRVCLEGRGISEEEFENAFLKLLIILKYLLTLQNILLKNMKNLLKK